MKIWNVVNPNIIIHNAVVHTIDDNNTIEQAIAIAGNKILAIGTNGEILKLSTEKTKIIDAEKRSVMPGIIDSHNHMWECGMLMEGIITFGTESIEELKRLIKEKISNMKENEWLQGGGWIESQFVENRMPTKYDLDEVSPNNPVVLERN